MTVTRFNPFWELQRDFEQFAPAQGTNFSPKFNLLENEKSYIIELELPGLEKDEIDIDISQNQLKISGTRQNKSEEKAKNYYKIQSSFGKFEQIFTLPDNANKDEITAKMKNGILEVEIVKNEIEQNKKIQVA